MRVRFSGAAGNMRTALLACIANIVADERRLKDCVAVRRDLVQTTFEHALRSNKISAADLFDDVYQPIEGSNPA